MSMKIEVIEGKTYQLPEEEGEDFDFYYQEVVEVVRALFGTTEPRKSWDLIDNAPVLCGKCKSNKFKVSSCSRDYESWCYCDCGHKFLVHTG